jgi:hypothetical protein
MIVRHDNRKAARGRAARWIRALWMVGGALAAARDLAGCRASGIERSEGMDLAALPAEEQGDYVVFAQRCSKCHSLARPLGSGISDDTYWERYVDRMRRQPGSGIRGEDVQPILRFLHWYSTTQATTRPRE